MNKKYIKVLAVLFVLNIIVYSGFGILHFSNKKDASIDKSIYISETKLDDVSYLYIDDGKYPVEMELHDGTWVNAQDSTVLLNQSAVKNATDSFLNITGTRSVSTEEDLSTYGLDDPAYKITVGDSKGNMVTYLIGDFNENISKYYVCEEGSSEVYTIYEYVGENLTKSPASYITAFDFDEVSRDDVKTLSYLSADKSFALTQSEKDEENPLGSNSDWTIEGLSFADSYKVSNLYRTIEKIGSENCAGLLANENTALTEPVTGTYKFDFGDKSFAVSMGPAQEDGGAYFTFDTSPLVFYGDSDSVNALTNYVDPYNFVSQSICSIDKSNVSSLEVKYGGNTYLFEFGEDGYSLDGAAVDSDDFESFYSKLIGLGSTSHSTEAESVAQTEESLVVTFNTTSEKYPVFTATYTPYDDNYYSASDGTVSGRLVNKRSVESVITLLKEVIN